MKSTVCFLMEGIVQNKKLSAWLVTEGRKWNTGRGMTLSSWLKDPAWVSAPIYHSSTNSYHPPGGAPKATLAA